MVPGKRSKNMRKTNSKGPVKSPKQGRRAGKTDIEGMPVANPDADSESGEPGGGRGRVEYVGPSRQKDIRIDPDIIEGHSGYEESGFSEIIPQERLIKTSKKTTRSKDERR